MAELKTCIRCNETKEVSLFNKKTSSADGYGSFCSACQRAKNKEYYSKNKERMKLEAAKYREENKEYYKEYFSKFAKENRHKKNAVAAKRRASKKQATPKWLTEHDHKVIEAKYAMATWLSAVVGIQYHVDHIIPLNGINVSGLHVPDNLSVIPAKDNIIKGNRFEYA